MLRHLLQRKTVWWPTRTGWFCLLVPPLALTALWLFWGETFLSPTRPISSEILVVEGWVGRDGLSEALTEFRRGGYRLVVTGGGPTGGDWRTSPWNYAELAAEELKRLGMPPDQLLAAPARETEGQNTYPAACAVRQILEARGELPTAINVWTRGAHARRSRLVFSRVFGSKTRVGVIAWKPQAAPANWWQSGDRARGFFEETIGYFYESLLNSGRW